MIKSLLGSILRKIRQGVRKRTSWAKSSSSASLAVDQSAVHLAAARAFAAAGALDNAITELDRCLSIDPRNIEVLLTKGQIQTEQRAYSDAANSFERVHDIDPYHSNALLSLVHISRAQKDNCRAAKWIDAALAVDPKNVDILLIKGQFLAERGCYAESSGAFKAILDLEPNNQGALLGLLSVPQSRENIEAQKDAVEALLAANPKEIGALIAKGQMLAEEGAYAEAAAIFKQALEIDVGNRARFSWFTQCCSGNGRRCRR